MKMRCIRSFELEMGCRLQSKEEKPTTELCRNIDIICLTSFPASIITHKLFQFLLISLRPFSFHSCRNFDVQMISTRIKDCKHCKRKGTSHHHHRCKKQDREPLIMTDNDRQRAYSLACDGCVVIYVVAYSVRGDQIACNSGGGNIG